MKADELRELASDLNEPDTYHLGQILKTLATFLEDWHELKIPPDMIDRTAQFVEIIEDIEITP